MYEFDRCNDSSISGVSKNNKREVQDVEQKIDRFSAGNKSGMGVGLVKPT